MANTTQKVNAAQDLVKRLQTTTRLIRVSLTSYDAFLAAGVNQETLTTARNQLVGVIQGGQLQFQSLLELVNGTPNPGT